MCSLICLEIMINESERFDAECQINMLFPATEILTFWVRIVVSYKVFELEISDTTQMIDFLKLFKMLMDFFRFCFLLTRKARQSDVPIFWGAWLGNNWSRLKIVYRWAGAVMHKLLCLNSSIRAVMQTEKLLKTRKT